MSTILDALNRAERERRMGELPPVERLLEPPAAILPPAERPFSGRATILVVGAIVGLGLVAALVALLRPVPRAHVQSASASVVAPAAMHDVAQEHNFPAARAGATASLAPPAMVGGNSQSQEVRLKPIPDKPALNRQGQDREVPDRQEPERQTRDKRVSAAARPEKLPTVAESGAPAAKSPAPSTLAEKAATKPLPGLNDLPTALRQQLPDIKLGGYIYSPSVSGRSILINGKLLREGDQLAPGLRLEQMRPDGVIFEYKEVRFRMAY